MKTIETTPHIKLVLRTRKRSFFVSVISDTEVERVFNTASYWDGGSKDTYTVRNLATGETSSPPCGSYPTFTVDYTLPRGSVLIAGGVFCGKPSHVKLYVHRADVPAVAAWLRLNESDLL